MATVAHKVSDKNRTSDVLISENISFDGLLLSETVINGLKNAGFVKPSPIQLKAIPLGRCGLDLIVQAKSGTGKTCVFSVIALESICTDSNSTQVLVLAPTREIAVQIWEVIKSIGSAMKGLECHTFIGGLPLYEDRAKLKKCHIAVGSPGRIKQLIETGVLRTENIRTFILDEADKLLEEGFQEQINWIYSTLPENKQMLALSATYPEYLADHLTAYMRNPTFLRLNISDPALLGIRQYYQTVTYHPLSHVVFDEKCKILINLLSSVSFQQCLVFSNVQTRASNLADMLNNKGWPTACIAGCLDQKDRNHAMAKLKTYKCRILISTDLTARGIDADKVNMVVNMDIPKDHETYLHRIGRAGRFGAFGIAVSLVSEGQEKMNMNMIEKRCNTAIHPLPDPLPADLAKAQSPVHLNVVVSTEVISSNQRETKELAVKANKTKVAGLSGLNENQHEEAELAQRKETDGDGLQSGEITTNKQQDVRHISNGHYSSENADEDVHVKKDFTLYDLDNGTMNGLHFTSGKDERDFNEQGDLDPDGGKMFPTKSSTFKNKIKESEEIDIELLNHKMIPNERHVDNGNNLEHLLLDKTQEFRTACEITNKINNAAKSNDDKSKELKPAQLRATTSSAFSPDPGVYIFPQQSDIDLSEIFKCSIGYKKQRNTLTYNTARQSLKEFRENFSELSSKPSFSISKSDAGMENDELLKVAVSQLQELFDRNLTVRVEPRDSVKQTISNVAQKIASSQGGPKLNQGECKSDLILTDVQSAMVKHDDQEKRSKSCVVGSQKSSKDHERDHKPVSNDEEGTGIVHMEENKEIFAKSVKHNGDVPSDINRPKRRFTNRFCIAHMVQPGESVFEYGGVVRNSIEEREGGVVRNSIEERENYLSALDTRVNKTEDSDEMKIKEKLNYALESSLAESVDANKSNRYKSCGTQRSPPPLENFVLDDIGAKKDPFNCYHPSMKMQIGNPGTRDKIPEDGCGYREVDSGMPKAAKTSKNSSFQQSKQTKPQRRIYMEDHSDIAEEFTSDSESDSSSDYDTSDSSEDTQKQDYSRRSSMQDYTFKQNMYRGTSHWYNSQHLFHSPHNFYQRPLEMAPPYYQSYNRGYSPYNPQYQQALGGYPYSTYYNPHVNEPYALHGNNYTQHSNMTDINQHLDASMKRCLNEQQDYIKAMSKNMLADKEKGICTSNKVKKTKKSSRKKKSRNAFH